MNSNARVVQKNAILVEISLTDGSSVLGKIFAGQQTRLTDVLNDERAFLPIEGVDGSFLALSKAAIKQVTLPSAVSAPYRGNNPYTILGVAEGVTIEELKKVYHELCKANHPDQIKGMGLGADYLDLATRNMVRINNAYAQILKNLENGRSTPP